MWNRKMNSKYIVVLILGGLLVSCKPSLRNAAPEYLYAGATKSVADTCIMERLSVFSFEDTPNSLFTNIDRALKFDGLYYLLDRTMNQILVFDDFGKYIRLINKIGNGVGEYSKLRDIAIDRYEKKLLLLVQPSSILYYNLDGTYDRTLSLKGYHNGLSVDSSNIYVVNSTYVNNKSTHYSMTVISKEGGGMKEVLEPLREIAPYCYSQGVPVSATDLVYYTRRFDNTIYSLAGNNINPAYRIDWAGHTFPENLKDQTYECIELNKLCKDNEYVYSITDVQESDNALLFRTNLLGLCVLSKKDKTVRRYNMVMNVECNAPLPSYIPVGGEGHEVFFVYPAYALSGLKKRIPEKIASGEVGKLIRSLNEESNPLVFRYELK